MCENVMFAVTVVVNWNGDEKLKLTLNVKSLPHYFKAYKGFQNNLIKHPQLNFYNLSTIPSIQKTQKAEICGYQGVNIKITVFWDETA